MCQESGFPHRFAVSPQKNQVGQTGFSSQPCVFVGGSLRGTGPLPPSGPLCSLTVFPILCLYAAQPTPSSIALTSQSLSQSARAEYLRGGAEAIVSGARLPGAQSLLTCPYLCLHICERGQCRELSRQETPPHLRCYHHTRKYLRVCLHTTSNGFLRWLLSLSAPEPLKAGS